MSYSQHGQFVVTNEEPEYYDALEDQHAMFEPQVNQWSEPSQASKAGQMDDEHHLQMKDLNRMQSVVLDISKHMSLRDCAKDRKNTVWTISPDQLEHMREVVGNANRTNATSSERTGNMERVVPIAATIIEVHNQHAVPIGVRVPGFVPNTFTEKGRYFWRMLPNTAPSQVEHRVSEPDNYLTKRMYKNWRTCDLDQLDQEIQISPNQEFSVMRTDGIAYDVLKQAVLAGRFPEIDINELEHTARMNSRMDISTPIAQKVYDSIKTPLLDIQSRCINMKDFRVYLDRADGRPWDSSQGLLGQRMSTRFNGAVDTESLYKPKSVGLKLKLDFITLQRKKNEQE